MDNLRGALLMVAAMAAFAVEDLFIKLISSVMSSGQIISLLAAGGALIVMAILRLRGARLWSDTYLHPLVLLRTALDVGASLCFVTAITLIPLSTASAILQAAPLVVTLGGALFLGQAVGWRRWSAICIGFAGVLLIIRPGLEAFDPLSLLAVIGTIGLAGRDIATRALPTGMSGLHLSLHTFAAITPAGFLLMWATGHDWVTPDALNIARLAICAVIGVGAYLLIVAATRIGDVAIVAPFRYSRLVFALVLAMIVLNERPDGIMLLGAAIVIASGIYTLVREARLRRTSPKAAKAV